MPIGSYFEKFPLIQYSNNAVVDITRKVKLVDSVKQNPYLFYPYTIQNMERPDQIADSVYENQYYDWMIYLSNEMIDPYYEYYLNFEEFDEFISSKYGSIVNAKEKVKYWRNNWELENELTISGYNSLLPNLKKYWVPEYRLNSNVVLSYKRKRVDWIYNINMLVNYTVSGNNSFVYDEMVVIKNGSNTIVGQGEIEYSKNSTIYLKNVQKVGNSNDDYTLIGGTMSSRTGNSSVVITSSEIVNQSGINIEEQVYYSPVSAYEYEYEKNEYNKTLIMLRSENVYDVNSAVEDLIKQNV